MWMPQPTKTHCIVIFSCAEEAAAAMDALRGTVWPEQTVGTRGLHSSTFQLNLSALYGIRGARRGCVARGRGVFRVCRVFLCVRHGSS